MKDWPRIAKMQSDLLAYALATGKPAWPAICYQVPGPGAVPLARPHRRAASRLHAQGRQSSRREGAEGQRILRDICRWHVEEFAYLVAKLKSIPEGTARCSITPFSCSFTSMPKPDPHKNNGMIALVAGGKKLTTGRHTRVAGTVGDLYLTVADRVLGAGLGKFPAANRQLTEILA